jgi:DNA-binding winged helix-turn-helix (wHTH) protein
MQLQPILPKEQREPIRRVELPLIKRQASPAGADTVLEFGRFRVLPRRRQLLADGVPVDLGTRAFDVLMLLIEADGDLVPKDELLALAWPGIFVDETNLKVQISALRKALGDDRDLILTEVGRGYRFTGTTSAIAAVPENPRLMRRGHRSQREVCRKRTPRRSPHHWCATRSNWPRLSTCSSRIG